MDSDMNKYDTSHVVTEHPLMSNGELQQAYRDAWGWFFTPGHTETVMRRAAACGVSAGKVMFLMLWFFFSTRYEGVHPLEGGYFRLRFRRDRRPAFPRESVVLFYSRYLWEIARNHFWMAYWFLRMGIVRHRFVATSGLETMSIWHLRCRRPMNSMIWLCSRIREAGKTRRKKA